MFDKFKDECGVFGIYGHAEAARLAYLGLYALQHRGQEACGIVSSDGTDLHQFRSQSLVADVLTEDVLRALTGASAIGHVRYSTAGEVSIREALDAPRASARAVLAGGAELAAVLDLAVMDAAEALSEWSGQADAGLALHRFHHDRRNLFRRRRSFER